VTIRVFIADDHQVVREGLVALIGTASDMVVVGDASTGEDALTQVCALEPDVVLVDIRLPDMNGIDLIRHLRTTCPAAQPIVLTIYDTNDVIFEALHAGARGYFLKDVKAEELLASIRAVHDGERRISAALMDRVLAVMDGQSDEASRMLDPEDIVILRALAMGKTNHQIATEQYVSLPTIKRQLQRIFAKLDVHDRTQAVAEAARRQLL
jgi:DNA-binding NarL/FixJ family response regulator